ncbi:MAG: hypothetical protein HQL14_07655 [Candidatus Omnitrophica bacterium]|nr:hypothetical protein [Candidatus Omnitrophota bacterium]
MILLIILGVVVLITVVVLSFLFVMLNKEGQKAQEEKAVPLTDLTQLKRELSSGFLEPQIPKTVTESDVIPAFVPKVTLPTQPVKYVAGDDIYKKRAQELEDELRGISTKAEVQSQEAKQMIASLSEENESLKAQKADLLKAQEKLDSLKNETDHLHVENTALQTQLDSSNAKVRILEQEMAAVKLQMGEEIARARAAVTQLDIEKDAVVLPPKVAEQDVQRQEFEALKIQHIQLKQNFDDLELTNQKLQDNNRQLMQKVESLQYELIKAKAQSTGLERIGFNYKSQLEDFFKKINSVHLTTDQLAKDKNRLEGVLCELENSRSQLTTLKREYEDFKAHVQQNNSK